MHGLETSYWKRGEVAFIGTWWHRPSRAEILAHLETVDAKYVFATTIRAQSVTGLLKSAGFRPVAYGRRNGDVLGWIQLWMRENPFFRAAEAFPRGDYNTFSCGMYQGVFGNEPRKGFLWMANKKPSNPPNRLTEICPGWWLVGRRGQAPFGWLGR